MVLDLTVVVTILSVAHRNGNGGIGFCAVFMSDADTGHRSPPLIPTTRRWTWRDTTMKHDYAANRKGTL